MEKPNGAVDAFTEFDADGVQSDFNHQAGNA